MILVIGLFLALVIWLVSLPYLNDKPNREQAWTKAQSNYDARYRQIAQEYDAYYTGSTISGVNGDFYSDGSLKYDPATKRGYEKGQYYCRSDGMKADFSMADASIPRPPK